MIVVIGSPIGRLVDGGILAGGMASRIALAAAAGGHEVQVVGRTGDDTTADGVVLAFARGGVGHVALLRDPARATPLEAAAREDPDERADAEQALPESDAVRPDLPTIPGPALEPADVDLGLRYLTEFRVVVLAEPSDPETIAIAADAVRWAEAKLVIVLRAGEAVPEGLPADAVVFEAPTDDPNGAFATVVGTFVADLDGGAEAGAAFRAAVASDGWTETDSTDQPDEPSEPIEPDEDEAGADGARADRARADGA